MITPSSGKLPRGHKNQTARRQLPSFPGQPDVDAKPRDGRSLSFHRKEKVMAKNRNKQRENRRLYGSDFGTELLDFKATAGYKDMTPVYALNPYIRGNRIRERRAAEAQKA